MGSPLRWMLPTLALQIQFGCGREDCPAIGCKQGVDITAVREPPAELTAGVYRVDVEADGLARACEIQLPGSPSCDDRNILYVGAYPKDTVSNPETIGVHLGNTPELAEVRVFRDGILLGSAEYQPTYTHTHLGGGSDDPCALDCFYSGGHQMLLDE
jgi:hypothetical protein